MKKLTSALAAAALLILAIPAHALLDPPSTTKATKTVKKKSIKEQFVTFQPWELESIGKGPKALMVMRVKRPRFGHLLTMKKSFLPRLEASHRYLIR